MRSRGGRLALSAQAHRLTPCQRLWPEHQRPAWFLLVLPFNASQPENPHASAFSALYLLSLSACLPSFVVPHFLGVSSQLCIFPSLQRLFSSSACLSSSGASQPLSVASHLCANPVSQRALPALCSPRLSACLPSFSACLPSSLRYPQLYSASSGSSAFLPVHFSEPSTFGRYATKHDIDAPRYSEKCAVRLRTLCFPNSSACFLGSSSQLFPWIYNPNTIWDKGYCRCVESFT